MKKSKNKVLIGIGIIFAVFMLIFVPISTPQAQGFAYAYGFMEGGSLKSTASVSTGANTLQLIVHTDWTIKKMKITFKNDIKTVTIKYLKAGQFAKTIGAGTSGAAFEFSAELEAEWQNIIVAGQFDYETRQMIPIQSLDGYYIEIEVLANAATEITITLE